MMIRFNSVTHNVAISCALAVSAIVAQSALADPSHEFVLNGGFEQASAPSGQLGAITYLTGWNSTAAIDYENPVNNRFTFLTSIEDVMTTGTRRGSPSEYIKLWGPGNGVDNGLTSSPQGGNFIMSDGAYYQGAISQLITGLTVGETYTLSFD